MILPARERIGALTTAPSSASLMARVGRRFLDAPRAVSGLPGTAKRMSLKLRAGVAEFLLISHLRARSQPARPDQSEDILRQGAQIIDVTCKNWFATASTKRAPPRYGTRI